MLRAPTKPRHNLPAHRVRLIGREHDLVATRRELLHAEGRLLALTGTGGCGKTRLALELASSLVDEFPSGVWLVELASLSDEALVPQAILSAVNLHERRGESLVATLIRWIGTSEVLLVLDNCGHLIEGCARLVEKMLDGCPELRVIATSREPLRIAGELAWCVPSLAVPDVGADPAAVIESPADQLFAERARTARTDFAVIDSSAATVRTICQRLGGVPLVVELAAARARTLSVHEILDRLESGIGLLTGGSRTAPTRQRTMRATLDWSYGLLSPSEQSVFQSLAVFADTYTLEAAEAICAGTTPALDVLDTLGALVEKSLVLAEEHDGEVRYQLLEPVRQYAHDRLLAAGGRDAARQRHLEYYLNFAELRERNANLNWEARGGMRLPRHSSRNSQTYGSHCAGRLKRSKRSSDYVLRARSSLCGNRAAIGARGQPGLTSSSNYQVPTCPRRLARLPCAPLAGSQPLQGRFDVAAEYYAQGLPLSRAADEVWVRWLGPQNVGLNAFVHGDVGLANELFCEARDVADAAGDLVDEGISLGTLAMVAWSASDFELAQRVPDEPLRACRQSGEEWAASS